MIPADRPAGTVADPIVVELAIIRQARHLSIRNLAAAAGLNPATVSRWENGLAQPSIDHLRGYAAVLGVDLAVVRRDEDVRLPAKMGAEKLAETLQRLVAEAAARLVEAKDGP